MIKLSLPPRCLWSLLSMHNVLDTISLVNYPELVEELKRYTSEELWLEGLYLDLSQPNHPTLYSSDSWIQEKSRQQKMEEISREHKANVVNPLILQANRINALKAKLISDKGMDPERVEMMLAFMTPDVLENFLKQYNL